jgi:hypothetical protein
VTVGKAWTTAEQRTILSAYAVLLDAQANDVKTNKAAIRRETLPHLCGRSAGSYEFKMCNISAALEDSGNAYVTGYKPRSGYQRSLLDLLWQMRPDLVPYARCHTCGDLMNYSRDPRAKCSLCQAAQND